MSTQKSYRWIWISGAILICLAGASLVDYRKSIEVSANLEPVTGTPLSGACKAFRTSTTSKGGTGDLVANPDVRYKFLFNGVAYEGHRYARSSKYAMGTPDQCEDYIRQFLKKTEITVWVDPRKPDFSVLEKDLPQPTIEYAFLLLGVLMCVYAGYRSLRKGS